MAITVEDIKKMSPQMKALSIAGIFVLIAVLYYVYFFSAMWGKKSSLETKLEATRTQIQQKEKIALQLDKYIAEVDVLKENYKIALEKLPDQREIPGLFHAVASSGKETGIDFLLFEPLAAVPKAMVTKAAEKEKLSDSLKPSTERQDKRQKAAKPAQGQKAAESQPEPFYEEIPVKVTVIGTYQSILHFFEKVAKLPRIVNISEISMGDRKDVKGRGYVITATCTIKTYMFIDKKEKAGGKTS